MSIWGGVLFTRNNTKGFTLIELLAVIVILAVIALIATPIVLNIIENARYGAAKSSAIGYVEASEKGAIVYLMANRNNKITGDCTAKGNVLTCGDIPLTLDVKGSLPTSGTVTFDNKGNVNSVKDLTINGYKFNYKDGKWTWEKTDGEELQKNPYLDYIGKYVNYVPNNETWDAERDGVEETAKYGNGIFNIYDSYDKKSVAGQSKNNGISCNKYYDLRINGWKIMNINNSGQITLIHAGTPECYQTVFGESQTIENKTILQTPSTESNLGPNKSWTKYGNSIYAQSVHYFDLDDYNTILKTINGNSAWYLTDNDENFSNGTCYAVNSTECGAGNSIIDAGVGNFNGDEYFIAGITGRYSDMGLLAWNGYFFQRAGGGGGYDYLSGVRPVIVLKSNVKIKEDNMDGSKEKPYNLTI